MRRDTIISVLFPRVTFLFLKEIYFERHSFSLPLTALWSVFAIPNIQNIYK